MFSQSGEREYLFSTVFDNTLLILGKFSEFHILVKQAEAIEEEQ